MNASDGSRYDAARNHLVLKEVSARPSEIEIQARLFNGELGTSWRTIEGEAFEILHFGEWNREAGPDFKGALIRFERTGELSGDIEVDREAMDWERHGHALNPAFAGVVLHLFLDGSGARAFARTLDHRAVPQARLLLDGPVECPESQRRDHVALDMALRLVSQAAEFRLRNKHAAHARASSLHGANAALFYAIAAGLGYKNNSIPFLLAAQRAGLSRSAGVSGEALLFGLAGFLEPRSFDDADEVTRLYLKPLWDEWWSVRDAMARIVLESKMWKFSGIRPSNHPHRRMGALAAVASGFSSLQSSIRTSGPSAFRSFLENLSHPYWQWHWNLRAARLSKPVALIGKDRIIDLLINALLPSLPLEKARVALQELRGPLPSGKILRASRWLTGRVEPALMRTAMDQQGLLQIYTDFSSVSASELASKVFCNS
ncbi:MAG: DUF2851 family protein [bacterium]